MPVEPLTINGPIPFGVHRDRTPASALLRSDCAVVTGKPGSGKTIVQQNLVAGLVRCPDCLVWIVDLSRGGLANPWLNPWLDGGMTRPVVDWLALDLDEAHGMMQAGCDIILARRAAYRQWMARNRTDKLPLTAEIPGVYIVIDEGKKVTGSRADQKLLAKIIQIADEGRAMGVRIIISGLRGTSEVIPSEMMADIGTRIGMSVSSKAEANYLFGWDLKPDPRDTPYPGCGLWRPDLAGAPIPFRSFDLRDPDRIARIAWASEPWRPSLDKGSLAGLAAGLGDYYDGRWERALRALQGSRAVSPDGLTEPGSPVVGSHPGRAQVSPAGASPRPSPASPPAGSAAARFAEAQEASRRAIDRAKRVIAAERMTGDRLDDEWARLAGQLDDDRAGGGTGWFDGDGDGPLPADNCAATLAVLYRLGPDGGAGTAVHAALADAGRSVSLSRVYDYLNTAAVKARHGVYVHPDHRSHP